VSQLTRADWPPNFDDPEAMKLVRALGTILAMAELTSAASTQDKPQVRHADLRQESIVVCGDGLTGSDCELARGLMRLALKRLSTSTRDWRIVVVLQSRWNEVADYFRVERTTPAFSSLGIRTTYVEGNLLFHDARIDENLQRYTPLTGLNKLTWIIAHEYGHILCETSDERKASAAAGRLIYGRGEVCR